MSNKNYVTKFGLYLSLFLLSVQSIQATESPLFIRLASVEADWDGDGKLDTATLTIHSGENYASLTVYLTKKLGFLKRALHVQDIVLHDESDAGRKSSLTLNKNKSIVIQGMNESVGRNRWHSKLTIVYRQQQFLVAGYSISKRDTLKKNSASHCDINYLSGKIIRNKKIVRVKNKAPNIKQWMDHWRKNRAVPLCS